MSVRPAGEPVGRRHLGAQVRGVAVLWVLRRIEADIEKSVAHYRSTGQPRVADALAAMYADLREAERQYLEARDGAVAPPQASAAGNAEAAERDGGAVSELVDCPTAAASLGISDRRVRQLLTAGVLTGTKTAGRWLVDREDVERLALDRRLAG